MKSDTEEGIEKRRSNDMRRLVERLGAALAAMAITMMVASAPVFAAAEKAGAKESAQKELTHLYGNHECPVSGKPVVADVSVTYANKEKGVYGRIYLCCPGCEKKAKKDIEALYTKLYRTDKDGKPKEAKDLKNEKCPMSGEKVDAKSRIESNGMIVHFCCADCATDFLKDPETKLSELLPNADEFKYDAKAGSNSSK
jgi:hypothetical protein